ncbi:MAG TPA: hypothetical protein VNK49_05770 [Anaerolineales bacterium]|nr:hypothetical protein [Anaerolineales bacterium]
MNIRCSFCQMPYTLSRTEMLAALQKMDAEKLSHYDAHCPRCRRATPIPRQRMEMFFPNWRDALKQLEAELETHPPREAPAPQALDQTQVKPAPVMEAESTPAPASQPEPEPVLVVQPEPEPVQTAQPTSMPKPKAEKKPAPKAVKKPSVAKAKVTAKKPASKPAAKKPATKKSPAKKPSTTAKVKKKSK